MSALRVHPGAAARRPARPGRRTTGHQLARVVRIAVVAAALVLTVAPFLLVLSTSLKSPAELSAFPPTWLPRSWAFSNYLHALLQNGFPQQLLNSIIYAGGSAVTNIVFCSLAGFGFAKMRFPGSRVIFALVLALLMVPAQTQLVPVFIVIQHIPFAGGNDWLGNGGSGLLNNYAGLLMPMAATPFGIFLMRQFFSAIPDDYGEAARVDGAGSFTVFWRIMVPMSAPAIATLGILSFQSAWNDFVWPLLLTSDPSKATLQLGLQLYQSGADVQLNQLLAAGVLTMVPVIALFLAAQRFFVGGLVGTGIR